MRTAILTLSLLLFLYYAARDNIYHFRGRRVTWPEHLLHLAIGIALVPAIANAFVGNQPGMLIGFLVFVVAGAVDEYIYHRGIPEHESDLHAKEHLALLIFIVLSIATDWLVAHDWRIGELFTTASL